MKKLIEMVAIEEKIREINKKAYERDSVIELVNKCMEEIKVTYLELEALYRQQALKKEIDEKIREINKKEDKRDSVIELAGKHIAEIEALSIELKRLKK